MIRAVKSLSEEDVFKIWQMKGKVSPRDAAELFDISLETVRRIWRGDTHRSLTRQFNAQTTPVSPSEADQVLSNVLERVKDDQETKH